MSVEQCWALNADRSRCEEPAADGQFFCQEHDVGYGLDPIDIFCLPEAEMPPNLVAYIRDCCPTWPFPEPSPPIVTIGPAAPAAVPSALEGALREPEPSPAPQAAPPPVENDAGPEPLAWLMAALRRSIEEVMAADVQPLQRANTVARLSGLYLRTYRATELSQANRRLQKQVAALQARLADAETPVSTPRTRRKPPAGSNGGDGNAVPNRTAEPQAVPSGPDHAPAPGTLGGPPTAIPGSVDGTLLLTNLSLAFARLPECGIHSASFRPSSRLRGGTCSPLRPSPTGSGGDYGRAGRTIPPA
jgi:hypothetical protein